VRYFLGGGQPDEELPNMPLTDVVGMTQLAGRDGYAIGYFESWNLESL